jgi:hypothetical protein
VTEQATRALSAAEIGRSLNTAVKPRSAGVEGEVYPADETQAAAIVVEWLNQSGLREAVEDRILAGSHEMDIARALAAYLVLKLTDDGRFTFPSVEELMAELGERTVTFTADDQVMVLQVHPEGEEPGGE